MEPNPSTAATSAAAPQPKIDPLRLLKCLSILLNPNGGIRGVTEVQRVRGLMAKYSKKLVSKCIYLNILQATDVPLLDMFYEEGGWELVGAWLAEAVKARNWPLSGQVLTLLEASPASLARLKRNTTPRLVKELSRLSTSTDVQAVARRLVLKWMEVVSKGDGGAAAAGMGLEGSPGVPEDPSLQEPEDSTAQNPVATAPAPTTQPLTPNQAPSPAPASQAPARVEGPAEGVNGTGSNEGSEVPQQQTGEGGEGSSSPSCQDESSNTSTESEAPPAPSTPIRITIRSGSQVLAQVSSQRVTQDSHDSDDDNKPLSQLRQRGRRQGPRTTRRDATPAPADTEHAYSTGGPEHSYSSPAPTSPAPAPQPIPVRVPTQPVAVRTIVTFTKTLSVAQLTPPEDPPTDRKASPKPSTTTTTTTTTTTVNHANTTTTTAGQQEVKIAQDAAGKETVGEAAKDTKSESECNTSDSEGAKNKKSAVDSDRKDDEVLQGEKKEKDRTNSKKKEHDKNSENDKDKEKKRESDREKSHSSSKSSKSSSSSSGKDKHRDRDRDRERRKDHHKHHRKDKDHRSSSSGKDRDKDKKTSSSSSSSSSSSKDREREKERERKEKEKEKRRKEEQESEDKATLEKVKPLSADGLAKIPRRAGGGGGGSGTSFLDALGSADHGDVAKKTPTAKTYKSRGFRNTGLLEEPTKPPGVAGKKVLDAKKPVSSSSSTPSKRPTPLDALNSTPPEKRMRPSVSSQPLSSDKPGGVKLISPKRPSLSDDGGFMAALTAAGPDRKKVTRKRKSSESDPKEATGKPEEEEQTAASSPKGEDTKAGMLSPTSVRPTFNFYQETLKDEDEASVKQEGGAAKVEDAGVEEQADTKDDIKEEKMDVDSSSESSEPTARGDGEGGGEGGTEEIPHAPAVPAPAQEDYEKVEVTFTEPRNDSLRSVLVYHRPAQRKRKVVKFRTEEQLQEVFYFELDETERVNVNTVKFNELMVMEKQREREQVGRGRGGLHRRHDQLMGPTAPASTMQEFMRWSLLPVMQTGQPNINPGCKSQERITQAARDAATMATFFHPAMLPDTPREPDPEMVQRVEPKEVPLTDVLGQDNVHDHRLKPWPEPLMAEPIPYGYGPPMGGGAPGHPMHNMGGGGSASGGGGSHWVIGGPPGGGFGGGGMYGGPPGAPMAPGGMGGYGGPGGGGGYGGDMGGAMDGGPGWGAPPPDFSNPNMMMGGSGGMMMGGGPPAMMGRNMMPNMNNNPRFRSRGGGWVPQKACRHFLAGHCRHGTMCKFLHRRGDPSDHHDRYGGP